MPLLDAAGDRFMLTWARFMFALANIVDGELSTALANLSFALNEFHAVKDVSGLTLVLDGFSQLAYVVGDKDRSARLAGFVARLESVSGTGLNAANRAIIALDPTTLRDNPDTADAWAAGETMSLEQAVSLALETPVPQEAD